MSEKVRITIELDPFYAHNFKSMLSFIVKHPNYKINAKDAELLSAVLDGMSVDV